MNGELISKELIEELYDKFHNGSCGNSFIEIDGERYTTDTAFAFDGIDLFYRKLMELPHEYNTWVYGEFDIPYCSKCGTEVMPCNISKYCPNCGAKMEEFESE